MITSDREDAGTRREAAIKPLSCSAASSKSRLSLRLELPGAEAAAAGRGGGGCPGVPTPSTRGRMQPAAEQLTSWLAPPRTSPGLVNQAVEKLRN